MMQRRWLSFRCLARLSAAPREVAVLRRESDCIGAVWAAHPARDCDDQQRPHLDLPEFLVFDS